MKNITLIFLIMLLFLISCNTNAETALQESTGSYIERFEDSCARGITDDPYPGRCALYVDKDDDGYCDYG